IKRLLISLPELLHASGPVNLRMHFEKLMLVVNEAVRVARRHPEIQLHFERLDLLGITPFVGEYVRVRSNFADAVLRRDIKRRLARQTLYPSAQPVPAAESDAAEIGRPAHFDNRGALGALDVSAAQPGGL